MPIVKEMRVLANSTAAARFEEKCIDILPSGCRIWMGAVNENGYGTLTAWGRRYKSHRAAWELEHGRQPDGHVLHRCDIPCCVNPDHLFIGTQAENMADMHAKGRGVIPYVRGERQGSSKLTEDCVREIRKRAAHGECYAGIAGDFDIDRSNVGLIVRRKGWAHVAD